jgi:hypothetical protein
MVIRDLLDVTRPIIYGVIKESDRVPQPPIRQHILELFVTFHSVRDVPPAVDVFARPFVPFHISPSDVLSPPADFVRILLLYILFLTISDGVTLWRRCLKVLGWG